MKLFALFDKVANRFISVTMCETEQVYVRSSLPTVLMDYPINDILAYCVGDFDEELGIVRPCQPRLINWNCYKFPEKMDSLEKRYLTIEQIDEMAKNKKHEFLKKQKDRIEDLEQALKRAKALLELEEDKTKKDKKRIKELREYINILTDQIQVAKETTDEQVRN